MSNSMNRLPLIYSTKLNTFSPSQISEKSNIYLLTKTKSRSYQIPSQRSNILPRSMLDSIIHAKKGGCKSCCR